MGMDTCTAVCARFYACIRPSWVNAHLHTHFTRILELVYIVCFMIVLFVHKVALLSIFFQESFIPPGFPEVAEISSSKVQYHGVGTPVTLQCNSTGETPERYKWFRNLQIITMNTESGTFDLRCLSTFHHYNV